MMSGSCHCGEVAYSISGEFTECMYCHCSICRKLTGSAFACYGEVPRSHFSWDKGDARINQYKPTEDTVRFLCRRCGGFLLSEHVSEPDNVYISLGTLDKWDVVVMDYHQFTASVPDWCVFDDDLVKYDKWPAD